MEQSLKNILPINLNQSFCSYSNGDICSLLEKRIFPSHTDKEGRCLCKGINIKKNTRLCRFYTQLEIFISE